MIQEGRKAIAFNLDSSEGGKIALKDLEGQYVVLYFYPRDNTPGCTNEANDFNAVLDQFQSRNAVVLGVSPDSIASHCKFIEKYKLKFSLLSDPDKKMLQEYGAWGEKQMYGKKSLGVIRSTVLISPDGTVLRHFPKVRVKGHVDKVLEALDAARK